MFLPFGWFSSNLKIMEGIYDYQLQNNSPPANKNNKRLVLFTGAM